jgi:hypothetical protein
MPAIGPAMLGILGSSRDAPYTLIISMSMTDREGW